MSDPYEPYGQPANPAGGQNPYGHNRGYGPPRNDQSAQPPAPPGRQPPGYGPPEPAKTATYEQQPTMYGQPPGYAEPARTAAFQPPPTYGQPPGYAEPAGYGPPPHQPHQPQQHQQPAPGQQQYDQYDQYGQPAWQAQQGRYDPSGQGQYDPRDQGQYAQPAAQYDDYGQYDQYGQPLHHGDPGGPDGPGRGPASRPPAPRKSNLGLILAGIGIFVVVAAATATFVLVRGDKSGSGTSGAPAANQTAGSGATAGQAAGGSPASGQASAGGPSSGPASTASVSVAFKYSTGQCVEITGPEDNSTIAVVTCDSSASIRKIIGVVSTGTSGNAVNDQSLCLPFKFDSDFETWEHNSNVLYCLSSTDGMHDLRYAAAGGCVYYTPSAGSYEMDCSDSRANYRVLAVLSNTSSATGCAQYKGFTEYFTSSAQDTPPFVVCGGSR
ncbi:MAG TPA: hypothetical protein VGX23_10475 [Actinocrinis sp.]|nr:hypothetical protein [Actinocrinis sp.]